MDLNDDQEYESSLGPHDENDDKDNLENTCDGENEPMISEV